MSLELIQTAHAFTNGAFESSDFSGITTVVTSAVTAVIAVAIGVFGIMVATKVGKKILARFGVRG